MTKLAWDKVSERFFETGIDRGVLYPKNSPGVPWNGLTAINEAPLGGIVIPYYIDGQKYRNTAEPTEYAATLDAFTYPDEFDELIGAWTSWDGLTFDNQATSEFDLCYRTKVGNDVDGVDHAYKLHFVYNALAAPAAKKYETLSASSNPTPLSWNLTTRPIQIDGYYPTAHLIVDSRKVPWGLMGHIEAFLYGTGNTEPQILTPQDLIEMFDWWGKYGVNHKPVTGLSPLVPGGLDLKQSPFEGLYRLPPTTRLNELGNRPGFYSLE